eukprot:m.55152 g.55152  ORF g.55152 m.55152 type:complete len:1101 (-) comp11947_c0_seq1:29-3331(-)
MSKVSPAEAPFYVDESLPQNIKYRRSHFIYSRFAAKPWKWFSIMLSGQLLAIVISLILYGAGYSLFPTQFGITSIAPATARDTLRADLAWPAIQADTSNNFWSVKGKTLAARSVSAMPIQMIFRSTRGNCLTKTNLRAMQLVEQQLANNTDYIDQICQRQSDGSCRKFRTLLSFFDGSYAGLGVIGTDGNNVFRADSNFDRIAEIISVAYDANGRSDFPGLIAAGQPDLHSLLTYNIGSDFNGFAVTTSLCRTMAYSGLPLAGFRNDQQARAQQLSALGKMQATLLGPFLRERTGLGDLEMFYHSDGIEEKSEAAQRTLDYYLTIGSLFFMLFALWLQTMSLWVSFFTLVGALGSYAWANLVYRIVLNCFSFSDPQTLSGFLIALLSGALSVYLIHLYRRLTDVTSDSLHAAVNVPRDAGALLATVMSAGHRMVGVVCIVMALAFFLSAASSFVVVRTFSLFAALTCLATYLTTMLFLPTVIATWANSFRGVSMRVLIKKLVGRSTTRRPSAFTPITKSLEKFFRTKYLESFIAHRVLRWLLISASMVVVAAFLIAAAVRLRVDQNQPVLWRSETNFGRFHNLQDGSFGQSDQDSSVTLSLVWGLKGTDGSHCHWADYNCLPRPVYDDQFDLAVHTSQTKLLEFCRALRTVDFATERMLHLRRRATVDATTGDNPFEIKCFITAQQGFFNQSSLSLPFTMRDLSSLVANNPALYPSSVYSAVGPIVNPFAGTYYRAYDVSAMHWLHNASSSTAPSADYSVYAGLLGGTADETARRGSVSLTYAGNFGDHLRYAAITVNLTLSTFNQNLAVSRAVASAWSNYLKAAGVSLPPSLGSVFASTPGTNAFTWAEAQPDLINSLIRGILLSLMVLWLVLVLQSGNWALASIATMTALWIVFILFGIAAFAQWSLGVIESVLFVMIVPLSALPITLLALAFGRTAVDSRREQMRASLAEAGPSILFVGLSGLGISVFLFGAQLSFMFQFATVFFSTCSVSCLFVLVFMSAMLSVAGPRRGQGQLWGRRTHHPSMPELTGVVASASVLPTGPSSISLGVAGAAENNSVGVAPVSVTAAVAGAANTTGTGSVSDVQTKGDGTLSSSSL